MSIISRNVQRFSHKTNITTITEQEGSQRGEAVADRRGQTHREKYGGVITWSGGPGSSYIAEGVGPVTRGVDVAGRGGAVPVGRRGIRDD